ncbi:MAG: coiled-coil domain-containing protein [Promethearchaeota archaeon]
MLSIDWSQVLEKPDKSFKVSGQFLLEQLNKIESLEKVVDELKSAKNESDQKVASLNSQIETVLGDLESEKKKNIEQEEKIEKLKEVVAGLEDNMTSADEKQNQSSTRVEELEGLLNSKNTQIKELENEKQELTKNLQKKIELLEEKKHSLEEQYKLKEKEVKEKIARISKMEKLINDTKSPENTVKQKDDEISSLHYKIQELEVKLSEFMSLEPKPEIEPRSPSIPVSEDSGESVQKGGKVIAKIPWKSGTGKFICPYCGSNRTEDVEDKSKVLYIAAGTPIYAKNKRCLNCGSEWSID